MALQTKEVSADEFAPMGPFFWFVGQYRIDQLLDFSLERGVAEVTEQVLVIDDHPGGNRSYAPLEQYEDLFTEFALLRTDGDISSFSAKYGHLGIGSGPFVKRSPVVSGKPQVIERGERISDWLREANAMAWVVDLWDRLSSDQLHDVITWRPNAVWYTERDGGRLIANATRESPRFFHSWTRGETRGPAGLALAKEINVHLRHSVSLQAGCDQFGEFKLFTRPLTLLGVMWYQMALAFVGKQKIKRCAAPDCQGFVVAKRSTKTMHETCAARARQRRYRESHNAQEKAR